MGSRRNFKEHGGQRGRDRPDPSMGTDPARTAVFGYSLGGTCGRLEDRTAGDCAIALIADGARGFRGRCELQAANPEGIRPTHAPMGQDGATRGASTRPRHTAPRSRRERKRLEVGKGTQPPHNLVPPPWNPVARSTIPVENQPTHGRKGRRESTTAEVQCRRSQRRRQ